MKGTPSSSTSSWSLLWPIDSLSVFYLIWCLWSVNVHLVIAWWWRWWEGTTQRWCRCMTWCWAWFIGWRHRCSRWWWCAVVWSRRQFDVKESIWLNRGRHRGQCCIVFWGAIMGFHWLIIWWIRITTVEGDMGMNVGDPFSMQWFDRGVYEKVWLKLLEKMGQLHLRWGCRNKSIFPGVGVYSEANRLLKPLMHLGTGQGSIAPSLMLRFAIWTLWGLGGVAECMLELSVWFDGLRLSKFWLLCHIALLSQPLLHKVHSTYCYQHCFPYNPMASWPMYLCWNGILWDVILTWNQTFWLEIVLDHCAVQTCANDIILTADW